MIQKKLPIVWNGKLVGYIADPKPDNLRHYGRWEPVKGTDVEDFISALMDGEEAVHVLVGEGASKYEGTVESAPDRWIEIHPVFD